MDQFRIIEYTARGRTYYAVLLIEGVYLTKCISSGHRTHKAAAESLGLDKVEEN